VKSWPHDIDRIQTLTDMNENTDLKVAVYQTFHKTFPYNPDCDWIQPLGVNGYSNTRFLHDNDGDNISALNPYYNELTAYYWAWKHSDADVVGFYHYRRYLNYVIDATWQQGATVGVKADEIMIGYLTSDIQHERLKRILGVCDVIVPKKTASERSIEDHYLHFHAREPWDAFIAALETRYPEHRNDIDLLRLTPLCSICNVFVMRRELFNEYCSELFAIIDPIFEQIGHPYDAYNNRYPGFLAERFLGFWLQIRRLRSFEAPLIHLS
jgi:hypothetical protein